MRLYGTIITALLLNSCALNLERKVHSPPTDDFYYAHQSTKPQEPKLEETIFDKLINEEFNNEELKEQNNEGLEKQKPIEKPVRYFDTLTPEYKALIKTIAWAEYTTPPCLGDISPYQILAIGEVVEDSNNRFGGRFGNWNPKPKKGEDTCRGQYFVGYDDHPRIKMRWHPNPNVRLTEASGLLQWMEDTFDYYRDLEECGPNRDQNCGLFPDFTPDSQDKTTMFVLQERKGITQEMLEKAISGEDFRVIWRDRGKGLEFFPIWKTLGSTWASLPFHNWGGKAVSRYYKRQRARPFKSMKDTYMKLYEKYKKE